MNLFDERGKPIKDGQIIKVYHYKGVGKKNNYMYKQVSVRGNYLFALHLPIEIGKEYGYVLKYQADSNGKIQGTRIVQCYCQDCIYGSNSKRCV